MSKKILRLALGETAKALRLDKPVLAVATALVVGAAGWYLTGQPAWGGVLALLAALLLFVPVFLWKLVVVAGQQLQSSEDKIAELEQRLAAQRDPDAVYQLGAKVGSAPGAIVRADVGMVAFPAITGAADFNIEREFEFRTYRLVAVSHQVIVVMFGVERTIQHVQARIVGRL